MVIEIRYSFWPEYKQLDEFLFIISERRIFIPALQKNSGLLLHIIFLFHQDGRHFAFARNDKVLQK